MPNHLSDELKQKLSDFIKDNSSSAARPLNSPEVEESILILKQGKISFQKITEFLKKEFDISVSVQAVAQKYKKLTTKKEDGNENNK